MLHITPLRATGYRNGVALPMLTSWVTQAQDGSLPLTYNLYCKNKLFQFCSDLKSIEVIMIIPIYFN